MPAEDFRRRAQMLPGPRFHLDWLAARLGPTRSRMADEAEFDEYQLERALPRYFQPSTKRERPAGRCYHAAVAEQYEVAVAIDPPWRDRLHADVLAALARRILVAEGVAPPIEVSLVVTDDETVRELNRRHLGSDEPTDVLSFPLGSSEDFVGPPDGVNHLGEVIIAAPTAERQAAEAGQPLAEEVAHLLVHGLLHLLGYDHLSAEDERRMRSREEALLGREAH